MGAGLALLLSKTKSPKDDSASEGEMEAADDTKEMGLEDEHLTDAFEAVKSGDKDAFMEAMKSAIDACMNKGGDDGN